MSDATLNQFVASGTAADMAGFTPSPPTPASGPASGYFFFQTDTGDTYSWDQGTTTWVKIASSTATGDVTTTGSPASGNLTKFTGSTSISNADLTGDVTTSGTVATTIAANAVTTSKITNAAVTLAKIANAAASSRLLGSGSSGSGSAYTELTAGAGLAIGASSVTASTPVLTKQITYVASGGGSALTATAAFDAYLQVEYDGTITANTVLADQSGSVAIAITKSSYSGFPGSLASIVASAPPTLSSAQKSTDSALTGWTTSVSAGDVFHFSISSVATVTFVTCVLTVTVT